ncbi:unnamed protein product [Ectocarpus sp. CCAP 1310/34]|nr:unnamed protein product [Ectocarpus sp. CCAP 1310/34]
MRVAQYKLAMSVFVVPTVVLLGAMVLTKDPLGLRVGASLLVSPAWLWMTVRGLEDGVACLNAWVELSTLLFRQGQGLEARVKATAQEHSLPSPGTLKAEAPARYKTRRFWRYFSPRLRRKMEWGEVVHMGHVGYDYPTAVQEQQNLAYGKGASPEGSGSGATDTIPPPSRTRRHRGSRACTRTVFEGLDYSTTKRMLTANI